MILAPEQEMIRDSVRQFAREQLAPNAARWDRNATFPADALNGLGEMGLFGIAVPEQWGGAGLNYLAVALAMEEIAAGDGATSTIVAVNNLVAGILHGFGSPAQKDLYLRPLAGGKSHGCFCLSEPHVGSDASAIRTSARRDAGGWVLNGTKQFITSGKTATIAVVFAITEGSAGKKGISAFVLPTSTPGYVVTRIEEKMGQHASDTAQIALENCRVPASGLIGHEGEGYRIALSNLEGGRISIAAQAVGLARSAYEAALAYARERVAFDKPIIEHQAVNFRLADMATGIEVARQMVWHAAPQGSLDGKAIRERDGGESLLGCDPDPRRLRLRGRFPGRAHLPGCARHADLRGGERHPAPPHRPHHRRGMTSPDTHRLKET